MEKHHFKCYVMLESQNISICRTVDFIREDFNLFLPVITTVHSSIMLPK